MNMQVPEQDYTTLIIGTLNRLQYWRKHIEKAIKRGYGMLSFTDVVQTIIKGQRLFIENGDAFAILEPLNHPGGIEVLIWMAGGKYEALCELDKEAIIFAKAIKAKRLTTFGREGFKRRIRPEGWKDTGQTMFVKEIQL